MLSMFYLGSPRRGARAYSFLAIAMLTIAVTTSARAEECGLQETPQATWEAWRAAYVSEDWNTWFACHSQGAQAALFLNAAMLLHEAQDRQGAARVLSKYGCEAGRAPLECVDEHTVAGFFHDVTVLNGETARTRLLKIWKQGAGVDGSTLVAIEREDENTGSATIQSKRVDGTTEAWTMTFVRENGKWFVDIKWGM